MADFDDTGAAEYTSDIHVHFLQKGNTRIYGTWKQLQDEGFVPSTQPMPKGVYADWRLNDCATLWVTRKWVPGSRKNGRKGVKLLDSDWWRISIHHDHFIGPDGELRVKLEAERREILELSYLRTPQGQRERHELINRVLKADADPAFQEFKQKVLPQRKGVAA